MRTTMGIIGYIPDLLLLLLRFVTAGHFPTPATVAVFVTRNGRILVIRRSDRQGYSLPGGYIKWYENANEAALRETKEETGLDIEVRGLVGIYSKPNRISKIHTLTVVYRGEIKSGQLLASSEGDPMWVRPNDIECQMAFNHAEIIADAQAGVMRIY